MNTEIPELFPKITSEFIAEQPSIQQGADLRRLVQFLRLFGVFGRKSNSNRLISRRIYQTKKDHEKDAKTGELIVTINDKYAEDRFDNILGGKLPLIAEEIEFLRLCLRKAFGDNLAASVSDDEICTGQAHLLIRRLLGEAPSLQWADIDPVLALQAMAMASDPGLDVTLHNYSGDFRNVLSDTYEVEFPEAKTMSLAPGTEFKLTIPKSQSQTKPLVIIFSMLAGKAGPEGHKKTIDYRGRIMPHVVHSEDKEGPWRVSMDKNKPLVIGSQSGQFGFLVIADTGRSVEQLFPDEFDPRALCDDDYKVLFTALGSVAASGDYPKMGLLLFNVHP